MATENISTTQDIHARIAHLLETCDGGPTFKTELKELASDVKAALTNGGTQSKSPIRDFDGPALAMAVLYEANDLLNSLRTVSEESAKPMGSAEWTLSGEVSRRLNQAIAYLDGAIPHPADRPEDIVPDSAQPTGLQRGEYALLVADGIHGIISGIRGIADALEGPLLEDIEDEIAQRLVMALQHLAVRLHDAAYNNSNDIFDKVSAVLEAPDSDIEAMSKRLREKGLDLWSHPTMPNIFGVSDHYGNMKMSIASLGEIENNLLPEE
jgi:hypothetical protein